jgi:hypothetical protein
MSRDDYPWRIRQKRILSGFIFGIKKIRIELSFKYDIYEPNENGTGER